MNQEMASFIHVKTMDRQDEPSFRINQPCGAAHTGGEKLVAWLFPFLGRPAPVKYKKIDAVRYYDLCAQIIYGAIHLIDGR